MRSNNQIAAIIDHQKYK